MTTTKESNVNYKVSIDIMVTLMKHHTGYSFIRGIFHINKYTHPKIDMDTLTGKEALEMALSEISVEVITTNKKGKPHTKKGTLGYFFDRAVNTHIVVTRYKKPILG